jgi:hypothetical protein
MSKRIQVIFTDEMADAIGKMAAAQKRSLSSMVGVLALTGYVLEFSEMESGRILQKVSEVGKEPILPPATRNN